MSRLTKFRGKFDVVTNLFTSFGYFSTDQENKKVLTGMVNCLKPGGKLVINTINRDFLMTVYQPARWSNDGRITFIEASRFDPKTKYNEAQMVFIDKRTGRGKNYYHRVRLYNRSEMVNLMKECGLKRIRVFGDFNGGKFNRTKSTHPIYVGEK
jgi:SAM-dependent methyltransferase